MESTNKTISLENKIALLSKDKELMIAKLAISLNLISMIASLMVVTIYLLMRQYYPRLADRVSFRLGVATSCADFIYSSFQLMQLHDSRPGFICGFSVWGVVFSILLSLFFSSSIAINLQIVVLHEYQGGRDLERFYVPCSIFLASFISILPITQNMYGWNEPEHRCWYRDRGDFEHIIWEMATIYVWIGSSLYCLCIVIVVILKLKSPKNNFESAIDSTSVTSVLEAQSQITPKTSPSNSLTSNIIKRVTWYPIIPIITQTPSFLFEVFKHSSQHISFSLYLACYVCAALQGFLHAVVFSQDIAVSRGCSALRMYLWRKYVHEYELRYPQYSLGCNNLKRGKKSSNAQNFENSVTNNFENPNLQNEDSKIHRLKYNSCAITSIWEPTTKESLQYKFFSRFLKHPTEKPLYKQKYTATPSIIKSRNDNQRKKAEQKSTIDQNIELIDIPTKNSMKNLEKNTEISKKSSFEAIAIPQNYSIINPDENPFLLSLQFPKHHRTQSSNYKTTNGNRLLYMTNNFNSLSSVDEVSLETTSNMSVDSSSKLLDTYFKKL